MTKSRKIPILFALAALLVLVGGTMFLLGMSGVGWDFKKLDRETLTAAEFSSKEAIHTIVLDAGSAWNYEIVKGEDFAVSYFESNLHTIVPSVQDGVFRLLQEDEGIRLTVGLSGFTRSHMTVRVAVSSDIALEANGSSIKVLIQNAEMGSGVRLGAVSVKGSSSDLVLKNVAVDGAVTMKGSSADVEMTNCQVAGGIVLDGSSADAELKNVTATTIGLNGSSIEGVLCTVTTDSVVVDGSSAKIKLTENSRVNQTLTLLGSSAKATVVDSSVREIRADGSSADVVAKNADVGGLSGKGASFDAKLELVGSSADILRASATGSAAKVYVDGKKGSVNGTGHKIFSVDGSSADLEITFIGGQSVF